MIDAIVREPDVDGNWLVYADWLCERGDPRGELINLGMAADSEDVRARVRELEADEERLISPRLAAQAHYWRFRWRRGFIDYADLQGAADDPAGVEALDALFADPHAALLAWVDLGRNRDMLAATLSRPRPSLRVLGLEDAASVDGLAPATPRLERLVLDVEEFATGRPGGVARLVHPTLRVLDASAAACAAACTNDVELPALEEIEWSVRDDEPLLEASSVLHAPPPRLRRLDLNVHPRIAVLEPLLACAAWRQLREVAIDDVAIAELELACARAPELAHLERLAIVPRASRSIEPAHIVELRARLHAALPHVQLDIAWERLAPESPRPATPPINYDAQSRGPDGRISALGAWASRTRRPT